MLVEKVRSLWAEDRERSTEDAAAETADPPESEPSSKLFSCPDCDVVYVAIDMDVCSSCRGEVREVSPTLSSG